jgi:hypothetical protein
LYEPFGEIYAIGLRMVSAASSSGIAPLRPHSRTLRRGVIGAAIDGRSKEGRYLKAVEADLTTDLGGPPSMAQTIAIHRCARLMLRLEKIDEGLAKAGGLTAHDGRLYNALQNSLRIALRELLKNKRPEANSILVALAEGAR